MAQQRSGSDKQASKSQNRSVAPTKKAPTKAVRRSSGSKLTWGVVGVVLAVVLFLVIYSLTSDSSSHKGGGNGYEAAPQSLVHEMTNIPASVYDTVGVTSSAVPVTPPTQISGQPPLTFTDATGTAKPGFFYYGAEYCPFCAAQRWAVVAALSRFGPISGLGLTSSSSTDVYPNTPSVSFVKAGFTMDDLAVRAIERFSNIPLPNSQSGYTSLTVPSKELAALVDKYDTATYFPGSSGGSIPFIDIGNQFLSVGSSFSPSIFNGLSRDQIAAGLNDPTNPVTQAIVATANYLSAAICKTTGGKPGNVCSSKGVQAAATALKISY